MCGLHAAVCTERISVWWHSVDRCMCLEDILLLGTRVFRGYFVARCVFTVKCGLPETSLLVALIFKSGHLFTLQSGYLYNQDTGPKCVCIEGIHYI